MRGAWVCARLLGVRRTVMVKVWLDEDGVSRAGAGGSSIRRRLLDWSGGADGREPLDDRYPLSPGGLLQTALVR